MACKLYFPIWTLLLAFSLTTNAQQAPDGCSFPALPPVKMKKNSVFLGKEGKATLNRIWLVLKQYPSCKIRVSAHGRSCGTCMQQSWDRTYSVVQYLLQKGLDEQRIVFAYGSEGPEDIVLISKTSEAGPMRQPPPVPCYSYHKLTPKRCRQGVHQDLSSRP